MIYKASPYKEEIVGGFFTEITLTEQNGWELTFPAQFLAYHQGGQIDI